MLKQYKKKRKFKINFGSVLAILAVIILATGIITGFFAIIQSKKKVDESTLNAKNPPLNSLTEGLSEEKKEDSEKELEEILEVIDMDQIFKKPLPESKKLETQYFDNVSFLGDSITEGLKMYGSGNPFIASEVGASATNSLTKTYERYDNKTLVEALSQEGSRYIYIMLGDNEVGGMETDDFIRKYENLVNEIKINNPNSIIFIQSLMPITKSYDEKEGLLTNKGILEVNKLLQEISTKHSLLFIDTHQALINEDGVLDDEQSPNDGIHFGYPSFEKWQDYILSHTVPEILEEEIIEKQQLIVEVK